MFFTTRAGCILFFNKYWRKKVVTSTSRLHFFTVWNMSNQIRAVKRITSLSDACFSMVDRVSADAEFGADFGLSHSVHIAVWNSKLQFCQAQGFDKCIVFVVIRLFFFKAVYGIHRQCLVTVKINVWNVLHLSAVTHQFAVYFPIAGKFDYDLFSSTVFSVNVRYLLTYELIQKQMAVCATS